LIEIVRAALALPLSAPARQGNELHVI
jgi:hypothetical protein